MVQPTQNRGSYKTRSQIIVWTLCWLVAFDVVLNVAFPFPKNEDQANSVARLLEEGRSTAGKHRRLAAQTPAPWWMLGNWIGSLKVDEWEGTAAPTPRKSVQPKRVAFFGNSFMGRTVRQYRAIAPYSSGSVCIGTYSPPSHALSAYKMSRQNLHADVVVMGILASSWPLTHSFSNAAFSFANAEAYTYPVYEMEGAHLVEHYPVVATVADLRHAFAHSDLFSRWTQQLRDYDKGYSTWVYDETALDASVLVRLLRRAGANARQRHVIESYEGPKTFDVELWAAMIREFSTMVIEDGRYPIVILFHDLGFGDDLYRALRPALQGAPVKIISSHTLFNANDPANYGSDLHYVDAQYRAIAGEVLRFTEEVRNSIED